MAEIHLNVVDGAVSIDGRHGTRDLSILEDMGISALHWSDEKGSGEIEHIGHDRPNLVFEDFGPYREFTQDVTWREDPAPQAPTEPAQAREQDFPIPPEIPVMNPEQVLLDHENRLRVLESKAPMTMAEFVDWIWGRWKPPGS